MPQTNVAIDMATLGDGIYSEEQKKRYERFLASGGNSRQLLTDLGESAMEGSKPSFNIFSLMNINALSDMQLTVAARIFGWFSKVDSWLYPAITAYSLWSMLVMVVKIAMAEIKIFREEGFALKKMLAALVDPIFYLLWLPATIVFGQRKENRTVSAPEEDPMDVENLYPGM